MSKIERRPIHNANAERAGAEATRDKDMKSPARSSLAARAFNFVKNASDSARSSGNSTGRTSDRTPPVRTASHMEAADDDRAAHMARLKHQRRSLDSTAALRVAVKAPAAQLATSSSHLDVSDNKDSLAPNDVDLELAAKTYKKNSRRRSSVMPSVTVFSAGSAVLFASKLTKSLRNIRTRAAAVRKRRQSKQDELALKNDPCIDAVTGSSLGPVDALALAEESTVAAELCQDSTDAWAPPPGSPNGSVPRSPGPATASVSAVVTPSATRRGSSVKSGNRLHYSAVLPRKSTTNVCEERSAAMRTRLLEMHATAIEQLQADEPRLESHWHNIVHKREKLNSVRQEQQACIWEFITTERSYIGILSRLAAVRQYLATLVDENIISNVNPALMFHNIAEVHQRAIEPVLCKARRDGTALDVRLLQHGLADIDQWCKAYIRFNLEYYAMLAYLKRKTRESALFADFVAWVQDLPMCRRLKLKDLLACPMQRLCRYPLLLKAIMKNTQDTLEKETLEIMIRSTEFAAGKMNAELSHRQQVETLQRLQRCIANIDCMDANNDELNKLIRNTSTFDLTAPMPYCGGLAMRRLILHGDLKLKDGFGKVETICYLFTDMFLVCKSLRGHNRLKIVKPPYFNDQVIVKVLKEGIGFAFIQLNEYGVASAAHIFQTNTTTDADKWIRMFHVAKTEYREVRDSANGAHRRRSSATHPASPVVATSIDCGSVVIVTAPVESPGHSPLNSDTDSAPNTARSADHAHTAPHLLGPMVDETLLCAPQRRLSLKLEQERRSYSSTMLACSTDMPSPDGDADSIDSSHSDLEQALRFTARSNSKRSRSSDEDEQAASCRGSVDEPTCSQAQQQQPPAAATRRATQLQKAGMLKRHNTVDESDESAPAAVSKSYSLKGRRPAGQPELPESRADGARDSAASSTSGVSSFYDSQPRLGFAEQAMLTPLPSIEHSCCSGSLTPTVCERRAGDDGAGCGVAADDTQASTMSRSYTHGSPALVPDVCSGHVARRAQSTVFRTPLEYITSIDLETSLVHYV